MPRITYEIEQIDRGWLVWRGVDGPATERVGKYPSQTRAHAEEVVETQRRADRAAATRLRVDLL